MPNQYDQLEKMTTIVADTGEIEEIRKYSPQDATTNPSLILKAASKPEYKELITQAVQYAKEHGASLDDEGKLKLALEKTFVNFGIEILKIVPGRVSTEVDARLSYDAEGSIQTAKTLIDMYEKAGIDRERVLIKLASTWEGIRAAEQLEKEGIHCNMTLMFSMAQAVACADARATLISPFVGRILDWFKKAEGKDGYAPADDPGVKSVTQIYNYYKKFGIKTQVMGASFRNKDEITQLAGCDLLTIAPSLLAELSNSQEPLTQHLDGEKAHTMNLEELEMDEKTFRFMMCEDAMATEKLSEGIRNFAKDIRSLETVLREMM